MYVGDKHLGFTVYLCVVVKYFFGGILLGIIVGLFYSCLLLLEFCAYDYTYLYLIIWTYAFILSLLFLSTFRIRLDEVFFACCGALTILCSYGNIIACFVKKMSLNGFLVIGVLLALPVILIIYKLRIFHLNMIKNTTSNTEYSDDMAINDAKEDLLGFQEKAKSLANEICKANCGNGLVWGIEAPWGTGKTSLVNLCKAELIKRGDEKDVEVKVFSFETLKYSGNPKLRDVLIDHITSYICKTIDSPELNILLGRYARNLKEISFDVWGIKFQADFQNKDEGEVFEYVGSFLRRSKKQIVIIIDDLDRISSDEIKQILYVVKVAYELPHVSYILCYDMANLCCEKNICNDASKNVEFLEKFVQAKVSLFSDKEKLIEFIEQEKLDTDGKELTGFDKIIDAICNVLRHKNSYTYYTFLGNLRAFYRLRNSFILLKLQKIDFSNYDFDGNTLLNLLLLHQNFPNVFREIYISETWSSINLFTAVYSYSEKRYVNSEYYQEEIESIKALYPTAATLVEMLFHIDRSNKSKGKNISPQSVVHKEVLLDYLNLIVRKKIGVQQEQTNYYKKLLMQYSASILDMNEMLSELGENEAWHMKLFITAAYDRGIFFSEERTKELIQYILQYRYQYAYKGFSHNTRVQGGREKLIFFIAVLLGKYGLSAWDDSNSFNTKKAGRLFFDIINNLWWGDSDHYKIALKVYDLLCLHLDCCAERMGNLLNERQFQNIISFIGKYNNDTFELVGNVDTCTENEMRYFSQLCYKKFKELYIDNRRNIFDDIDKITERDMIGYFNDGLYEQVNSNSELKDRLDDKTELSFFKNQVAEFILYQFGNQQHVTNMGVPCGFYDVEGNSDKGGIGADFTDYIFDVVCAKAENFIRILLMLLANDRRMRAIINIDGLLAYLDRRKLIKWWRQNGETVKVAKVKESFASFYQNQRITSQEGLMRYYKLLDDLIDQASTKNGNE